MQLHWRRDTTLQLFQRHIGKPGYEYDLDIRVEFANSAASFDTIDARRHAHIEDNDIERRPPVRCFSRQRNGIITLAAGDNIEMRLIIFGNARRKQLSGKRIESPHFLRRLRV
jgi:hypothetical protein